MHACILNTDSDFRGVDCDTSHLRTCTHMLNTYRDLSGMDCDTPDLHAHTYSIHNTDLSGMDCDTPDLHAHTYSIHNTDLSGMDCDTPDLHAHTYSIHIQTSVVWIATHQTYMPTHLHAHTYSIHIQTSVVWIATHHTYMHTHILNTYTDLSGMDCDTPHLHAHMCPAYATHRTVLVTGWPRCDSTVSCLLTMEAILALKSGKHCRMWNISNCSGRDHHSRRKWQEYVWICKTILFWSHIKE